MSDDKLKRDLQFIQTLKEEKSKKSAEIKELENKITSLRKNPADKIMNDLYIYQYNKEITVLKGEIETIDNQITSAGLQNSFLDEQYCDNDENYNDIMQTNSEKSFKTAPKKTSAMAKGKHQNFKNFFMSLTKAKLIFLAIACLFSSFVFYQLDLTDIVSIVGKYNRLVNITFICLLSVFTCMTLFYFSLKNATTKKFGCFADYCSLFVLYFSLNILVGFLFQRTIFKFMAFSAIFIPSFLYIVIRIKFYGKNIDEAIKNKSIFIKYYYELFKKYSLFVFGLFFIICFVLSYLFGYTWITKALFCGKKTKWLVILDTIILTLAFLYYLGFSFIRKDEKQLKVIDVTTLLLQLYLISFFIIGIIIKRKPYITFLIVNLIIFVVSIIITILRIKNYKDEV